MKWFSIIAWAIGIGCFIHINSIDMEICEYPTFLEFCWMACKALFEKWFLF
jgi:hypothetical protein